MINMNMGMDLKKVFLTDWISFQHVVFTLSKWRVKIMIMIMMIMMVMMKVMMVLLHPSVLPQIENASGCNKRTALFFFIWNQCKVIRCILSFGHQYFRSVRVWPIYPLLIGKDWTDVKISSSVKFWPFVKKIESESESIVEKEMCDRDGKNQLPSQAGCLGIATLPMTRAHQACVSPLPPMFISSHPDCLSRIWQVGF